MKDLPSVHRGTVVDVAELTDDERRELGLSHLGSITDVVGDDLVAEAIEYARSRPITTLDIETGGKDRDALDPYLATIVLVQIGDAERQYLIWWQTLSDAAKELVRLWLVDEECRKAGVNLKFDISVLMAQEGWHWKPKRLVDCQLLEQILGCGVLGTSVGHTMALTGMEAMARRWFGWTMPKSEDIRTGWGDMRPGDWGGNMAKRYYAADDCVVPIRLVDVQTPWLQYFELIESVRLEMDFLPELAEMELRGIPFDRDAWQVLVDETDKGREETQRALDKLFKVRITERMDLAGNIEVTRDKNYGATRELQDLLHEWMWENEGICVICTNEQFKNRVIAGGLRPERTEKLFRSRLVPNPNKPGHNLQVGYPGMSDYIDGSEYSESYWTLLRDYLPEKSFPLTSTDSDLLRLMRIIHERPKEMPTDPNLPNPYGLPPVLVDPILAMRDYKTSDERYSRSWFDLIHPVTGRIHSDFSQTATNTRRLSSSPNFQNIKKDKRFRAAMIHARPGRKIVTGDLSQIEPRIIAELSNCAMYMRVFWSERPGSEGFDYWCGPEVTEPLDLYGTTGANIGIMPPDADKKRIAKAKENSKGRDESKIFVLGLGYGTGKSKFYVSYMLDTGEYCLKEKPDRLFDAFWEAAWEVKECLDELSKLADPKKSSRRRWHPIVEDYVTWAESLGGSKRFFDGMSPAIWTEARNMPVQCLGAEIMKRAHIELNRQYRLHDLDAHIVCAVHDEFVVDAAEADAAMAGQLMLDVMSEIGEFYCEHVPISAEYKIGDYWQK